MGLSVADDEDDSPIPSPSTRAVWTQFRRPEEDAAEALELRVSADQSSSVPLRLPTSLRRPAATSRKRLFDVESLLAPDAEKVADEPEIVTPGPEIDSTVDQLQHRDGDFRDVYPVPPPDRKRRAISSDVDDDDAIVGPRQPIRAVLSNDDVITTSGVSGKQIADDKRDVVTSLNSLPGRKSADRHETGSRFSTTRQCVDAETTSGVTTSGMCADPEVARFWLRHANMASSRFARAFLPLPLTAYNVTRANADVSRARDINQGHGHCQGQSIGQGQGPGECYCEDRGEVRGRRQDHDCIKVQGHEGNQCKGQGQGRGGGQFEGQGMEELRKLSESVSPAADEKNRTSPVDVI